MSDPSTGAPRARVVVTSLAADRQPLTAKAPGEHVALVPVGICHGAELGHDMTLCGLETQSLAWFPGLSFAASEFLPRCASCLEEVEQAAS